MVYYGLFEKYGCKSFKDALERLVFNEFAPLKNEIRDVLIEEFGKEHATYYEIVSALARGKVSQGEISDLTHVSQNSLANYFYDLIELLDLVEHKIPVTERAGKSKKGRYFLKDNFFRFYGYFIYPRLSQYMAGEYEPLLERVEAEWDRYSGFLFENMVRDLLTPVLRSEFPQIGPWWDRKGNEIDLVGINLESGKLLLLEVKDKELSEREARKVLNSTLEKAKYIKNSEKMQVEVGLVARKIGGRNGLEAEGFRIWEMDDLLKN